VHHRNVPKRKGTDPGLKVICSQHIINTLEIIII
jgi:hypothetical protein